MPAELYRNENSKTIIVFKRGYTKLHCLMIAPPVRVVKLEKIAELYFAPLLYKGAPYPLRRALRLFKASGKTLGITDGAKNVLKSLKEIT